MKILLFALLGLLPVQSPLAAVSGTWVAERAGTTFIRLELNVTNNTLAGRMGAGDISVDDKGEVIDVGVVPNTLKALLDVKVTGSSIVFVLPDENDRDQFRLTVIGADQADLAFVPSEEMLRELKEAGVPLPKPIRLHKIR